MGSQQGFAVGEENLGSGKQGGELTGKRGGLRQAGVCSPRDRELEDFGSPWIIPLPDPPELSVSVLQATPGQFPVALAPSTLMLFKQLRS